MSNSNQPQHQNKEDTNMQMLAEQYKLYVQLTDQVSHRRQQTNTFFCPFCPVCWF